MRACGGISNAAQLDEPEASARRLRRVQLVDAELGAVRVAGHVDEEMAEDPVHLPGGTASSAWRQRRERDLELVELARRAPRRRAGAATSGR
jgi:hypothetical protein